MRFLPLLFSLFGAIPLLAQADSYFDFNRNDQEVPAPCRDFKLGYFSENSRYVIYGLEGAAAKGFTHEYPLSRKEASVLWKSMQSSGAPERSGALGRELEILVEGRDVKGFAYRNEGDVLEALALSDLEREYPPSIYFHTGGLAYHEAGNPVTIGELDLVVARRSDCKVVMVGEAKLGLEQLGHARKQLRRIDTFLKGKLCRSASGQPEGGAVCGRLIAD